ncbi:Disease resistance protein RPM1 [Citrus sinensis]|uniref:Disease resistance protein RPM1 n=1 Tax=Citrus sinensis TaxID=2711 RepID=A0ACB8P1Y6_CITSI|nr:Disease resistance protein RPM1 [Citrus sinensis]
MAEAAVNFALETLGPLLVEEIRLFGGVRKEVQSIKSELESLRSFLKDADTRAAVEELEGGGEESVRTWVKQLRDEAYRIEDFIDEYALMVAKLPHESGLVGVLHRISRFIKKLRRRRGVATEIQDSESALADIKRRGESYRFRSIDEPSRSGTRNVIPHDSPVRSFFVEDDEVVGIESIKDKLIDLMVNGRSKSSVVAVVGEGGLGKTTLAGKLFNNEGLKTHFSCRAWVTVGKEYNKNDLLRTIIKEFHRLSKHGRDGPDRHAEGPLEGQKIIVTTRHMNVAKFCKSSSSVRIHELETLPPDEAWKLFCRKAFGPSSGESCKINRGRLIRLWIAEGFVQYRKRLTSEQVAAEYLDELIDRSLVQVSNREIPGRAIICQVHDLMHEIIIRKTEELGFGRLLNGEDSSHCSKTRRITIQRSIDDGALESIKDWKVRSVILFNVDKLPDSFMKSCIANFKLMKVLDLEDSPINYLPEGVGNLFNLHLLNARNTKLKIIPKSIGNLLSLEILVLARTFVSELPEEIRNLKKLRSLIVFHYKYITGSIIPTEVAAKIHRGFGSLRGLLVLSTIEADSQVLKELMMLRQLRMLSIRPQNGNGRDLCALIANLENVETLGVLMTSKEEILDLQSLSSPPQHLRYLSLRGNMKKLPDWILKLKNLIGLRLILSGLTEDPISILQALPNLLELMLHGGYDYELFHFEAGWFPKLRKLVLLNFEAVKLVIIEKGAMPDIRELWSGPCPLLMEIPIGIEHLRNLELFTFHDMSKQVCCMTKNEKWEVTEHIPDVRVTYIDAGQLFYCPKKVLSSLSCRFRAIC